MADALSHLAEAIQAMNFVTEGAGIAPVEIRLADERDGRKLIAFLNATQTAQSKFVGPFDDKGHEFTIDGVKVTWPQ